MRTILAVVTSVLLWGQSARAEDAVVFRSGDEVIVAVERLDLLRQAHKQLPGTVQLTGAGGTKHFALDFTDPVTPPAIVIDVTGYGACASVTVEIKDGNGKAVLSQRVSPVPTVTIPNSLPMQQGRVRWACRHTSRSDGTAQDDRNRICRHRAWLEARSRRDTKDRIA